MVWRNHNIKIYRQARYVPIQILEIDEFGWWALERISADAGKQFTSTDFKQECQTQRVHLTVASPKHQEMNRQVDGTW